MGLASGSLALGMVLLVVGVSCAPLGSGPPPSPENYYEMHRERFSPNLANAVGYLQRQYNAELQLAREAKGPGGWEARGKFWTMDKVYHLADSRLASLALKPYDPGMSARIARKVGGYSPHDLDGKADLLGGKPIPLTPWIQDGVIVEEGKDYIIFGARRTENLLLPIDAYADVTMLYSIQAWRAGQRDCARDLLRRVLAMWDGKGLLDGPAKYHQSYAVYKLAMLLLTLQVVDAPFPDAEKVEGIMWGGQDESGGVITGITFDGGYVVGPNTETTALVVLAYDQDRVKMLRTKFPLSERWKMGQICQRTKRWLS